MSGKLFGQKKGVRLANQNVVDLQQEDQIQEQSLNNEEWVDENLDQNFVPQLGPTVVEVSNEEWQGGSGQKRNYNWDTNNMIEDYDTEVSNVQKEKRAFAASASIRKGGNKGIKPTQMEFPEIGQSISDTKPAKQQQSVWQKPESQEQENKQNQQQFKKSTNVFEPLGATEEDEKQQEQKIQKEEIEGKQKSGKGKKKKKEKQVLQLNTVVAITDYEKEQQQANAFEKQQNPEDKMQSKYRDQNRYNKPREQFQKRDIGFGSQKEEIGFIRNQQLQTQEATRQNRDFPQPSEQKERKSNFGFSSENQSSTGGWRNEGVRQEETIQKQGWRSEAQSEAIPEKSQFQEESKRRTFTNTKKQQPEIQSAEGKPTQIQQQPKQKPNIIRAQQIAQMQQKQAKPTQSAWGARTSELSNEASNSDKQEKQT